MFSSYPYLTLIHSPNAANISKLFAFDPKKAVGIFKKRILAEKKAHSPISVTKTIIIDESIKQPIVVY